MASLQQSLQSLVIRITFLSAPIGTLPYLSRLDRLEVHCYCQFQEQATKTYTLVDLDGLPALTLLKIAGHVPRQDLCSIVIGESIRVRRLILCDFWDQALHLSCLLTRFSATLIRLTLETGIDGRVITDLPNLQKLDLHSSCIPRPFSRDS